MKAVSFYPPVKPVILFPVYYDEFEVSLLSESRGDLKFYNRRNKL